ncbi:hypothetical protein BDV37DRAFT_126960 [Aspergillus pseudonomiae]|uniref:Uncharacterized protein n=1 Tax=Aspergillus pseudonomiae TaxID=1506151 RepID=A0A5N7DCM7_9EURO|nr:uncharacterized protein BDV37DRAFT_126960 [Aspergillus pseudonomiae]KAE8403753.1 hypothetical protein BDV37DRAFT_126960 [Aspergillus pseudonomiae]
MFLSSRFYLSSAALLSFLLFSSYLLDYLFGFLCFIAFCSCTSSTHQCSVSPAVATDFFHVHLVVYSGHLSGPVDLDIPPAHLVHFIFRHWHNTDFPTPLRELEESQRGRKEKRKVITDHWDPPSKYHFQSFVRSTPHHRAFSSPFRL